MTVVDASVWVSLFVADDIHHDVSRAWFAEQAERGRLLIAPAHVLAEIAGAVARRTGEAAHGHAVVRLVKRLPRLRLVAVERRLADRAAFVAAELTLRGADALYVALADLLEVPLVTWDGEQSERAAALVEAAEPVTS